MVIELYTVLSSFHYSYNFFKSFKAQNLFISDINPLDYVYRCLGCKIQLMEELDVEAQYILRYISATFSGILLTFNIVQAYDF